MNPIETFLLCVAVMLATWFVASGIYDLREQKQQKRIAKLERDLSLMEYKIIRQEQIREQFEQECG